VPSICHDSWRGGDGEHGSKAEPTKIPREGDAGGQVLRKGAGVVSQNICPFKEGGGGGTQKKRFPRGGKGYQRNYVSQRKRGGGDMAKRTPKGGGSKSRSKSSTIG